MLINSTMRSLRLLVLAASKRVRAVSQLEALASDKAVHDCREEGGQRTGREAEPGRVDVLVAHSSDWRALAAVRSAAEQVASIQAVAAFWKFMFVQTQSRSAL